MADVIQKIISGNDIKNGSAVITADKRGNYQSITPDILENQSLTVTEAKYTTRFDDPSYYSN